VQPVDAASWPSLVCRYADRDHQAAVAYLERIAADRGEHLELVAVRSSGADVALAAVRLKRPPLVGGGIGLVAGGPLVATPTVPDPSAPAVVGHYAHRGVRLHVRPPTLAAVEGWFGAADVPATSGHRSPVFEPYETMVIDLSPGVDVLRQRLSANWRRHLNKAERSNLRIDTPSAADGWRRLRTAYETMVDRKGFDISLTPEFWTAVLDDPRSATDFSSVVVADADTGQDLAGVVLGGSGDLPVYVLGASVVEGHDRRAGYLAQWAAVVAAAGAGHPHYDLGGVDKVGNPGGWQFKDGMRGRHLIASPPLVFSPRGPRGAALSVLEGSVRRLRSRSGSRAGTA
jgi:hypothetical protein